MNLIKSLLDDKSKLTLFFLVLFVVVNNLYFPPHNILSWDIFGYYLYLPFKFIYNDLGILNEATLKHIVEQYHNTPIFYQLIPFPDGHYVFKYSMGLAVFYLPFFLIGHVSALLVGFPADGFSEPYQISIFLGCIVYSIIGLVFLRKVLIFFFNQTITSLVLIIITLCTNYIVHVTMDGQNGSAHNLLFTSYSIILWATINWYQSFKRKYLVILAIACGLTILSRPSEIVCLLIPLLWRVNSINSIKDKLKLLLKYKADIALFALIIFCIGSLQLIYWKLYAGKFVYNSYGATTAGEGFEFTTNYIIQVLFSFRKGWFIYTPVMILILLGLLELYKKNKKYFSVILLYTLFNLYLVSSWSCWWYATSFSQRSLIPSYPIMAILIGYALVWLKDRNRVLKIIVTVYIILCFILNIFQTIQLYKGVIDGSRMTKEYYFRTFGKLSATEEDRKLLLIERSASGSDVVKNESEYQISHQLKIDFENFKNTDTTIYLSGKKSIGLKSLEQMPVLYAEPYYALTKKDHFWVKINAHIYPLGDSTQSKLRLWTYFSHKGWPYALKRTAIESFNLKPNKWNGIEVFYLSPEVRRESDSLKIEFRNLKGGPIYIDDVKISILEKKE